MSLELNRIHQGDSWQLASQLDDESVDCIVTSPPYFGLRDYGTAAWEGGLSDCSHINGTLESDKSTLHPNPENDKRTKTGMPYKSVCGLCGARRIDLQAGLEEHPLQWVEKMRDLCRLLKPKLKKSGTMWWNIGETYYGGNSIKEEGNWLQPKQMLGLPWRFAIALQDDGWILRNAVAWHKPNRMPSSVRDRMSNAFEYLFFFTKSRKYWFDLDAIREKHKFPDVRQVENKEDYQRWYFSQREKKSWLPHGEDDAKKGNRNEDAPSLLHPLGKNPGDVWEVTTRPHPFAHFAVFPEELVERPIKAGCPKEVCVKCGKARERMTEPTEEYRKILEINKGLPSGNLEEGYQHYKNNTPSLTASYRTIGFTDCGCNAGFSGGVVLDPFMGSGTSAVVAKRLGRNFIGFELNPEYIKIAELRLKGFELWHAIDECQQKLEAFSGQA